MEHLRWILIFVGLLILGGIYLFGNPDRKRSATRRKPQRARSKARRKRATETAERVEPTLGESASEVKQQQIPVDLPVPDEQAEQAGARRSMRSTGNVETRSRFDDADSEQSPAGSVATSPDAPDGQPASVAPAENPAKVVSLYVVAQDNQPIPGVQLLDAALKTGLTFGAHNIFHRLPESSNKPVFSMANLTAPGHFDRTAWNLFETRGVTLFMTLPGPLSAADAWDSMLAAADRLSGLLNARVQDDKHKPLTRQRIGEIREDMRDFDRQ